MAERSIFVGFDVHKDTIAVASAVAGGGPPVFQGTIAHEPRAVRKLVRRLGPPARLQVCYEAGPFGYGLQRQLAAAGIACVVVAPSLIPTKPGDRVKTDRRDALQLARLHRSGELTPVWAPDLAQEALRDLSRLREALRIDLHRARQRLRKFLLRHGLHPPTGVTPWTQRYTGWLDGLGFAQPPQQATFVALRRVVRETGAHLAVLEVELQTAMEESPHRPLFEAWQTLRGVGPITAGTLVAELGDCRRFDHPTQLMAYVGVVPREHSSGSRQRRGGITKTGNSRLRHVLIEAAWKAARPPRTKSAVTARRGDQPPAVTRIAERAEVRLQHRYRRLVTRRNRLLPQQAVVAVARELVGYVWAIAQEVPPAA
jgi:transposase